MELKNFVDLSNEQEKAFSKYMEMIIEWNKKINLTAITEKDEIIIKHFIDSITLYKYINNNSSIIDIGTGAGFPGIPLKIYDESLDITLLDSLNKRIKFLDLVINELNLKNIKAIHGRAEDLGQDNEYREKFDIVVSRAVANLSTLLEYMLPFCKVGGKCLIMKGPNIEQEIKNSKRALKELGGKIETIDNFFLKGTDIERNIIIVEKMEKTKKQYPRKAGTPAKQPI